MKEWTNEWANERRGRELRRLEPAPRRGIIKLHCGLSKELSSLVVQMRTGKIGENFSLVERCQESRMEGANAGKEIKQTNTFSYNVDCLLGSDGICGKRRRKKHGTKEEGVWILSASLRTVPAP